jgi:hypothetical protein
MSYLFCAIYGVKQMFRQVLMQICFRLTFSQKPVSTDNRQTPPHMQMKAPPQGGAWYGGSTPNGFETPMDGFLFKLQGAR